MNDHRDKIRKKMMENFLNGGIRAKILWLDRWFSSGDGFKPMYYLRQLIVIIFGLINLGEFIVTQDYTKFIPLAIFLVFWIPFATLMGFLKHWWHFTAIESYIGRIMDPLYYDVNDMKEDLNGKS